MKVVVLASGSRGNCSYVGVGKYNILIDMGMTCSYTEKKLRELNIEPKNINCVFITHTHTDHIAGLKIFYQRYKPTLYLTKIIYEELSQMFTIDNYVIINEQLYLSNLVITIIKTSHDTNDSVGYIMESKNESVVYITDTGYINVKNYDKLCDKSVYIIECNHDIKLLMDGTYPYYLKQRILGDKGHLSNIDCANYLKTFIGKNTQYIFLAHLSENNNDPSLALQIVKEELKDTTIDPNHIKLTNQNEATELVEV